MGSAVRGIFLGWYFFSIFAHTWTSFPSRNINFGRSKTNLRGLKSAKKSLSHLLTSHFLLTIQNSNFHFRFIYIVRPLSLLSLSRSLFFFLSPFLYVLLFSLSLPFPLFSPSLSLSPFPFSSPSLSLPSKMSPKLYNVMSANRKTLLRGDSALLLSNFVLDMTFFKPIH